MSVDLGLGVVLVVALVAAYTAQLVRWLRVLQREHYDPRSMRVFLGRWTSPQVASATSVERSRKRRPLTLSHVLIVAVVVTSLVRADVLAVIETTIYGVFCPQGLSVRGRTSRLEWTRRLTYVAVATSVVSVAIAATGVVTDRPWLPAIAMVWAVPITIDVTTRALAPLERHRALRFVAQAKARLERVKPRIVGITGSYGKTSTKNHLSDLLSPDGGVVASPRSFINRAGLSRAINENLADGTRIFIAEMGTYGRGEIRDLCSWCPPELAVVTAIGPVHLERMKSVDEIEEAKYEITERASTVVLNVDDSRLARWVDRLEGAGKRVRTAASHNDHASVRVVEDGARWTVVVDGTSLGSLAAIPGVQKTNLACALAAALELGLALDLVPERLGGVTSVAHRARVETAPSGLIVIDDTFNANPASAVAALALLKSLSASGRRAVVTPGFVEMGAEQYSANLAFANRVQALGYELVAVGRTNVVPLGVGYGQEPRRFDRRDQAVAWVRSSLGDGDAVLYLNDLPDHYP